MVDLSQNERAQIRSQQCFFRATSDIPGYGRFYSADARFPCSVAVPGMPRFVYHRGDEQYLGVTFNIRGEEDVAVFRTDLNDFAADGEDEVDYARRFERDSYAAGVSSKARIRPRIGRVAGFTAHRVDYANGWQRVFFVDSGRIMWNIHNRGIDDQAYARIVSSFHFLSPGNNFGLEPATNQVTTTPGHARWGVVAILLAVVSIVGVLLAVLATHHNSVTAGSASAQSAPASATQTAASPAGLSWVSHRDPSGFSIKLPVGWTVSFRSGDEVDFTGQPPGFVVLVAWTRHPKPDALTDWRQQAAAKAQSDPTYQQIRIQRVTYRGYNAADWDFINVYRGELTHVIDRGFIVRPGHLGYAIEIYGPAAAQWSEVYASMWTELVASFEPAT